MHKHFVLHQTLLMANDIMQARKNVAHTGSFGWRLSTDKKIASLYLRSSTNSTQRLKSQKIAKNSPPLEAKEHSRGKRHLVRMYVWCQPLKSGENSSGRIWYRLGVLLLFFKFNRQLFLTMQSQFFGFQRPETKLINTEILKVYAIYAALFAL